MSILVVEDNEANRELIREYLEAHGHEVAVAEDGHEGVRLADQVGPKVILLDIQMPGMNGFAVARRLRQDPRWAEVPIVALTAYAMQGDRERVLEAGFDSYLAKPLNLQQLLQEVEHWLSQGRGKGAG